MRGETKKGRDSERETRTRLLTDKISTDRLESIKRDTSMLDTFCEPCVPIADRLLLSDLSRPFLRAEFHRDVDPRRGTRILVDLFDQISRHRRSCDRFSSFHLSRLLLLSNKRALAMGSNIRNLLRVSRHSRIWTFLLSSGFDYYPFEILSQYFKYNLLRVVFEFLEEKLRSRHSGATWVSRSRREHFGTLEESAD